VPPSGRRDVPIPPVPRNQPSPAVPASQPAVDILYEATDEVFSPRFWRLKLVTKHDPFGTCSHGRTGPPGCLAFARWAGWSGVQVGRHVKLVKVLTPLTEEV